MRTLAFMILLSLLPVAAQAQRTPDDVVSARQHYTRGKRFYDVGRFADAAREYEAAYEAKDDPALLFNLGQAHRLAGNSTAALLAYKAYLRNVPQAPNRAEVEARVRELQTIVDEQARPSAPPPPAQVAPAHTEPAAAPATAAPALVAQPARPADKTPVYKKWWLWTIVGVAVAGAAVGLGVGLTQSSGYPSVQTTNGTVRF
jgi:hypothetical protein